MAEIQSRNSLPLIVTPSHFSIRQWHKKARFRQRNTLLKFDSQGCLSLLNMQKGQNHLQHSTRFIRVGAPTPGDMVPWRILLTILGQSSPKSSQYPLKNTLMRIPNRYFKPILLFPVASHVLKDTDRPFAIKQSRKICNVGIYWLSHRLKMCLYRVPLFPRFFAVGKRLIIDLTPGVESLIEQMLLMFGGIQSVFHRFTHEQKYSTIA